MRFVVDAQLTRRMTGWFRNAGCDAAHTLDLPNRNRTTDEQLLEFAEREQRVVVSKDADFVNSHTLFGSLKNCCWSRRGTSATGIRAVLTPLIPSMVVGVPEALVPRGGPGRDYHAWVDGHGIGNAVFTSG